MSYALLQVVRDVDKDLLGVQRGLGAILGVVEEEEDEEKEERAQQVNALQEA